MSNTNGSTKRRAILVGAGVAGVVVVVSLLIWWWTRPPQLGTDEGVIKTVDALFTAVTARDEKLLADCAQQLLDLKHSGKLPPQAFAYLDNIINKARAGRWESAAQSLYDFVRAQRREETDNEHSTKKEKGRRHQHQK
jgi:hypothetical protein